MLRSALKFPRGMPRVNLLTALEERLCEWHVSSALEAIDRENARLCLIRLKTHASLSPLGKHTLAGSEYASRLTSMSAQSHSLLRPIGTLCARRAAASFWRAALGTLALSNEHLKNYTRLHRRRALRSVKFSWTRRTRPSHRVHTSARSLRATALVNTLDGWSSLLAAIKKIVLLRDLKQRAPVFRALRSTSSICMQSTAVAFSTALRRLRNVGSLCLLVVKREQCACHWQTQVCRNVQPELLAATDECARLRLRESAGRQTAAQWWPVASGWWRPPTGARCRVSRLLATRSLSSLAAGHPVIRHSRLAHVARSASPVHCAAADR